MILLCFVLLLWIVQIREYHRRHPAARVVDANEEFEAILKDEPVIEFSGEVFLSFSPFFMIKHRHVYQKMSVIDL